MPKEPATIRARGDDRQEHACSCSALPKAAAYPQPRPTAGTDMGKHQPLASLSHPEISYQFTNSFICGSRIILRLPKNCLFLLPGQLKQIFENFQFTRKKTQLAWGSPRGNCKRSCELSSEDEGDIVPKTSWRASGAFANQPLPRRPSMGSPYGPPWDRNSTQDTWDLIYRKINFSIPTSV